MMLRSAIVNGSRRRVVVIRMMSINETDCDENNEKGNNKYESEYNEQRFRCIQMYLRDIATGFFCFSHIILLNIHLLL